MNVDTHTHTHTQPQTDLVDEGGEAVVEALDLLLLVGADRLDVGVNGQVERGQQALVHRHRGDGGPHAHTHASTETATHAHTHASATCHAGAQPHASVGRAAGDEAAAAAAAPHAAAGPPEGAPCAVALAGATHARAAVRRAAVVPRSRARPHGVAGLDSLGHSGVGRRESV